MAGEHPNPPRVWGLLGHRRGDNQQVVALGTALGWPFETKQLRYGRASRLPNVLRRSRPLGVAADSATPVAPPWPDLVIAVGRRSVPLALAIRAASGGQSRLVQLGRPGAPVDWFDLVLTTPQYQLPAAANVLQIPLPFGAATEPSPTSPNAGPAVTFDSSRPLHLVLVGGPTAELRFEAAQAFALAELARSRAVAAGATLAVTTSPRTPPDVAAALVARLPAPHFVHVWRPDAATPYAALLAAADRVLVTADSVSMLADACRSGAVVEVFPLPERSTALRRIADRARAALARRPGPLARLLSLPFTTGVRKAPRRYSAVHDELVRRGLLGPGACPAVERRAAIAAWEDEAVERVRALLKSG
jgi:uncharacterized protein